MKFLIQRVTKGSVTVEGKVIGQIGKGFFVLIGVCEDDTKEVSFKIAISTNLAPADTEKVQESIANDLAEAFAKNSDVKSKLWASS